MCSIGLPAGDCSLARRQSHCSNLSLAALLLATNQAARFDTLRDCKCSSRARRGKNNCLTRRRERRRGQRRGGWCSIARVQNKDGSKRERARDHFAFWRNHFILSAPRFYITTCVLATRLIREGVRHNFG